MRKLFFISLLLIGAAFTTANAQCPMCRTAVESGMDDEHAKGKGLNDGILYLLATPYLAVGIIGGVWYHKNKKK